MHERERGVEHSHDKLYNANVCFKGPPPPQMFRRRALGGDRSLASSQTTRTLQSRQRRRSISFRATFRATVVQSATTAPEGRAAAQTARGASTCGQSRPYREPCSAQTTLSTRSTRSRHQKAVTCTTTRKVLDVSAAPDGRGRRLRSTRQARLPVSRQHTRTPTTSASHSMSVLTTAASTRTSTTICTTTTTWKAAARSYALGRRSRRARARSSHRVSTPADHQRRKTTIS